MFRFRLGSIPVDVHFSHLAISGLVAWWAADGFRPEGWPGPLLEKPGSKLIYGLCIALWMSIVSVSILVHEAGQAIVSRLFGYRPTIHLVGLGGLMNPNPNETIPWHRDVLLTLAGPLSGLTLGLFAGATGLTLKLAGVAPGPVTYCLFGLFAANLAWAALNLLPVASLDGGRISSALLIRLFGRKGFLFAQLISVSLGVLVIAIAWREPLLVLLVALNVLRGMAFISSYFKGDLPVSGPTHPFEIAFLQALQKFKEGKLEDACELLKRIAEQDLQPALQARVHDLSGWVALKQGDGTKAQGHFAQVQGLTVAPQALAAAHSLVGDDKRALPLWEEAARTTRDPTLQLEWAGALIRNDQPEKARELVGDRIALGYAAAARMWFVRQEFLRAAEANEASFREEPNFERGYDAACGYALAARADDALRMLELAGTTGQLRPDKAQWDPELVSLRSDPRFASLLEQLRAAHRVRT